MQSPSGGRPLFITVDNGSEFAERVMDAWSQQHGVQLVFIRLSRQAENGFIESFTGRLGGECLNAELFSSLDDVARLLTAWRHHYNHHRPRSALGDGTPAGFGAMALEGTVPSRQHEPGGEAGLLQCVS